MFILYFHGVMFAILASAAVWLGISIHREDRLTLDQIMRRFSGGPPHLSELSCNGIFSEGIYCPADELWDRIGGLRGVWTMYYNLGVLIDVLRHLEKEFSLSAVQMRNVQRLIKDAFPVRITVLSGLVVSPIYLASARPYGALPICVQRYAEILTRTNLAIHDTDRSLMARYIQLTGQRGLWNGTGD